jgi:hypothetical protein
MVRRGDSSLLPWHQRTADSRSYRFALIMLFSVSFWALMLVPYMYDQANRRDYEDAVENGQLIIREFRGAFEELALARCNEHTQNERRCESPDLFGLLRDKKLIALDYVAMLQGAQQLTLPSFLKFTFVMYILLAICLFLLTGRRTKTRPGFRALAIGALFIAGFVSVQLLNDLPHKNVKFYYTVGFLFAALLPWVDFVHFVKLNLPQQDVPDEARRSALQYQHRRWTTVLGMGLAFLLTLIGTVSFNIVDYEIAVFGEGFIFYPLLGVVIVLVLASFEFVMILRHLIQILQELETAMSLKRMSDEGEEEHRAGA